MFTLAPGEALTLSRLARKAGCERAAQSLSCGLAADVAPAEPGPRGLAVLAAALLESGTAGPAAALLQRIEPACAADPYLGERVAGLALRLGAQDLCDRAAAPARAIRRRARDLGELDEEDLRLGTRQWLGEVGDGGARAYVLGELARVWHRIDRLDIAVALARRAVLGDRDYGRARTTLVKIEAELGAYAAAAAVLHPGGDPVLETERAILLARAGDVGAGASVLTRMIDRGGIDGWSPEQLWNAAEAARMLGIGTQDLAGRLDGLCATDPDAAMRILENTSQAAGGDHRLVNIKDGLQRLLRQRGRADLQPETYILPDEEQAARARVARFPQETWILKPARMFGGRGAQLVAGDPAPLAVRGPWVLQRYLDRPWLVDGHKAHMRCYLLVVPGWPRRVYLSHDGIVRLAPRPWDDGSGGAVERHITNTNLHWKTGELRIEEDAAREDAGHVRRLSAVLSSLGREQGEDLFAVLHGFAGEVVAAVHGALQSPLVGLIALDLLLDADGRFHLLEIESRPQFVAGGVPVVGRIHRDLGQQAQPILAAHLAGGALPDRAGGWRRL